MSEFMFIPLLGLYFCYAYVASDTFRSFVRSRQRLKWFKRWVGG